MTKICIDKKSLATYDAKLLIRILAILDDRRQFVMDLITAHQHAGDSGLLKFEEIRETYTKVKR